MDDANRTETMSDGGDGSSGPGRPQDGARRFHDGERVGDWIGPYQLIEILGEGGFGMVWLAERREPMVQRVAIKIVKPGMDSKSVIARFEQERQALAVMDHPNVARVFDAGATPLGRPYFVMEYVQGEPITAYCDRHRLGTRDRLQLFASVCDAVEHAHTKGIIHRDLKPSNVLAYGDPDRPVAKVIDFGIAKAVGAALAQHTAFTEQGQLIGTPEYMSPEQADFRTSDIDTRTDVYSLGVMLYELLSGTLPFDPSSLRSAGFAEIQRIIREVDPPTPGVRLSALGIKADEVASRRRVPLDRLRRELARELEWIPLKAMQKDRTRRYRSPAELGDDVRNYLQGKPLIAGPESAAYRVRKFVRRRKPLVAGVLVGAAAVVVGVAGLALGLVRASDAARAERKARSAEAEQRKRAENTVWFFQNMLGSVEPEKAQGREVTVRELLDRASEEVGQKLGEDPILEASMRETIGETYFKLGKFAEAAAQLGKAAALRAKHADPDDRQTLTTRFNVAAATTELGNWQDAKAQLTSILVDRARALGPDDPDTLVTRGLLAYVNQRLGDNEGALAEYRATLESQQRVAPGSKDTLETMASIADVLQDLARFDEAEKAAGAMIEAATKAEGPDSVRAILGMSIRASILQDLGRLEESEALVRVVLEKRRRIFGPEHPDTLVAENVLGRTLTDAKKYAEAEGVLRHAADAAARTLGEDHHATGTYLSNLARVIQLQLRAGEAEAIYRRVAESSERTLGGGAQATIVALNNLATTLLDQRKSAEAEPILRRVMKGVDDLLPPEHWMRGQARINLGEALGDLKKFEEAEDVMLAGWRIMDDNLPKDSAMRPGARKSLADLYTKWGKPEGAAAWREGGSPK